MFNKSKNILAVGAALALAATAMGRDFAFPSPWNPAGLPREQLNQYILITWDDNAYSGLNRTGYEPRPGANFSDWHFVGGMNPDESAPARPGETTGWVEGRPNDLNITETGPVQMGMNWSLNLRNRVPAANAQNFNMTYFMLAGFYVNVFTDRADHGAWDEPARPQGWQAGQSVLGSFTGEQQNQPWVSSTEGYVRIPVSWGREFRSQLGNTDWVAADQVPQQNTIYRITRRAFTEGHEIANHSLDHFETNSMIFGPDGRRTGTDFGFRHWTNEGFGGANATGRVSEGRTASEVAANRTSMGRVDVTAWGQEFDVVANFGTAGRDLERGWITFAGRQLSREAWRGAIYVAHYWLTRGSAGAGNTRVGGAGIPSNRVTGWRAPRLESNSNMFFALSDLGYVWDSSLEEGFDMHVNGQNFLWPFTMCNGTRNSWVQTTRGSRAFHDTMPTGLWQIPINVLVVPEDIRGAMVDNWNKINDALNASTPGNPTPIGNPNRMDINTWDGKITGFDFNVFVQWGATADQFRRIMTHNLDLRMNAGGNRAPLNWGTHTDYYTPIYDNATLLNPFNQHNFGLLVSARQPGLQGFGNNWEDRITATEGFVADALSRQNVRFVTGMQMIERMREMVRQGEARRDLSLTTNVANSEFVLHRTGSSESNWEVVNTGEALQTGVQAISVGAVAGGNLPFFRKDVERGSLANMTHISVTYRSRTATAVRLIMEDENGRPMPVREVILAHRFSPIGWDGLPTPSATLSGFTSASTMRESGPIPLTSFDFEEFFRGIRNYSAIDPANIVAIEIMPLAPANSAPGHGLGGDHGWGGGGGGAGFGQTDTWEPTWEMRTEPFELAFEFSNIRIYRGEPMTWENEDSDHDHSGDGFDDTSIARVGMRGARALNIAGITNNSLRLNVAQAGTFNIGIYNVAGRRVQNFRSHNLAAGMNNLQLNNLARGVHVVRIQGVNVNQSLTRQVVIR